MKRLIAILTLLQIFSSCIKNPVDSGDVNTSINLVNNGIGEVRLSWDKTNISTFKEYILLSSPTPIKIYKQLSEIPTNVIKQRITDFDENKFIEMQQKAKQDGLILHYRDINFYAFDFAI